MLSVGVVGGGVEIVVEVSIVMVMALMAIVLIIGQDMVLHFK